MSSPRPLVLLILGCCATPAAHAAAAPKPGQGLYVLGLVVMGFSLLVGGLFVWGMALATDDAERAAAIQGAVWSLLFALGGLALVFFS